MITLDVMGIRLLAPEDSPVLVLQERGGTRVLPIWIAAVDAAAIAVMLEDREAPPRPLTHDLVATLLEEVGDGSGAITITDMREGVFYATITTGDLTLDARPSDAISVALRMGWEISCSEQLMDQVGVEVEQADIDEVERFKEFLDSVNPDDFEG